MAFSNQIKGWLRDCKKIVALILFFPSVLFASDNPFDVMGIQEDLGDQDIVAWFQGILQSEYFPLILGAVGLMILVSSGLHIHHGIKKARDEGAQVALTDFTSSLIAAIVGIALIGLGFTINGNWSL